MNNKIKVIKNILWLLGEHGVRLIVTLVITSILAKVLGVEGYGIFNYILGIMIAFLAFSSIGGAEVIIPQLSNASSTEQNEIIGNTFFVRLFFATIAYIALILFIYFTDTRANFYLAIILCSQILFSESFAVIIFYFQAKSIIQYKSIIQIIIYIIKTIIFIILYKAHVSNIYVYAFISSAEFIILSIALCFAYWGINKKLFFTFTYQKAHDIVKKSMPFFIGLFSMYIFQRLDVIILRHLSSELTLGLYASSKNLFNSVAAIAPMIAISFAPVFIYKISNTYLIKRNIFYLSLMMFLLATIGACILYIIAPTIVNIIFGNQFLESINIFRSLLCILPLYFLNESLNIYLIKFSLGKLLTYKWIITLCITSISYLILIPLLNAYGAAISLFIGYTTSCLYGFFITITHKGLA